MREADEALLLLGPEVRVPTDDFTGVDEPAHQRSPGAGERAPAQAITGIILTATVRDGSRKSAARARRVVRPGGRARAVLPRRQDPRALRRPDERARAARLFRSLDAALHRMAAGHGVGPRASRALDVRRRLRQPAGPRRARSRDTRIPRDVFPDLVRSGRE